MGDATSIYPKIYEEALLRLARYARSLRTALARFAREIKCARAQRASRAVLVSRALLERQPVLSKSADFLKYSGYGWHYVGRSRARTEHIICRLVVV